MARKVSYPKFVDTDKIESLEENNCRYWLRIPFKNKNNSRYSSKKLCVILKNPSDASDTVCDNTISKVCNVAKHNGYSEVTVLNLFPYRSKKAKEVINFYKDIHFDEIMKINKEIIMKKCKNHDVVFAWGTNTISTSKENDAIYKLAIKETIALITSTTYYVISCSCENQSCNKRHADVRYPLHGLRWHNDSIIIPY